METVEERVVRLKKLIEMSAVACGLNLTVYEGKIAFVDMEQKKIVAVWNAEYSMKGSELNE